MTNNNVPDNARNFDDVDVPAYDGAASAGEPTTPVERVQSPLNNRALPETVAPQDFGAEETTVFASASAPTTVVPSVPTTLAPEDQLLLEDPSVEELEAAERQAKLEERKADPRRGTLDFGLLFVRLALSAYLIIAGASTFFGLGASEGLGGLEKEFAAYALPQILSIVIPTLQLLAGVFLLLGLVTPFAAMIALVVTGFTAVHDLAATNAGLNIFAWSDSFWLSLVLFLLSIAVQFTGPGVVSFDYSRSWARRPLFTSWVFVVLGIAALVAGWWFGAGVNPLAG